MRHPMISVEYDENDATGERTAVVTFHQVPGHEDDRTLVYRVPAAAALAIITGTARVLSVSGAQLVEEGGEQVQEFRRPAELDDQDRKAA